MLALFFCNTASSLSRTVAASLCTVVLLIMPRGASADQVRISNLSDVNVPLWVTGDPDIIEDVLVCVYREDTTGSDRTYGIQATGDGPGFFIRDGSKTIAYTLTWNDGGTSNPNGGSTTPLVNGVTLSNRQNARINTDQPTGSTDCNGGASPTAQLRLTIPATNMDAATDGTYSGTITLLLSLT